MRISAEQIVKHLAQYCKKRNAAGFLVDCTRGTLSSILTVALCAKTNIHTCAVVHAPSTEQLAFLRGRNIEFLTAEPKNSWITFIQTIHDQNLIAVGSQNICELEWIRNYEHFTVMADILPLGSMPQSGVNFTYLEFMNLSNPYEKLIYDNRPEPSDIIGNFGITYDELEWAHNLHRSAKSQGSVLDPNKDPAKHPRWFSFTARQKTVLAKIHQIRQQTDYKSLLRKVTIIQ